MTELYLACFRDSATKLRYDQALSLKDRYILLPFDIAYAHKLPWCYL